MINMSWGYILWLKSLCSNYPTPMTLTPWNAFVHCFRMLWLGCVLFTYITLFIQLPTIIPVSQNMINMSWGYILWLKRLCSNYPTPMTLTPWIAFDLCFRMLWLGCVLFTYITMFIQIPTIISVSHNMINMSWGYIIWLKSLCSIHPTQMTLTPWNALVL